MSDNLLNTRYAAILGLVIVSVMGGAPSLGMDRLRAPARPSHQ